MQKQLETKLKDFKTDEVEELSAEEDKHGQDTEKQDTVMVYVSGGEKLSFESVQDDLESTLKNVQGVKKIYIDEERLQDTWQFHINKEACVKYGISPAGLIAQISESFAPYEFDERLQLSGEPVKVFTQSSRHPENIEYDTAGSIQILTPNGMTIPLSYLGQWQKLRVLKKIEHKDLLRKFEVDVKYDSKTTDKEKISKSLQEALKPLQLKYPEFEFTVKKESDFGEEGQKWLLEVAMWTIALILLALMLCLGSVVQPFLVAFAIPFGIIGIIWAHYLHGRDLTIMSMIGLLGMMGVVVNDSIVLADTINRLTKKYGRFDRDLIVEAASQRIRPVFLTSMVALAGAFPMAYGIGGESGFTQPLAFSIGWGLLFGTTLTLFLFPALMEVLFDITRLGKRLLAKLHLGRTSP